jgi:hypothetical protein
VLSDPQLPYTPASAAMQVLQDAQPSSAAADAVHTRHRQLRAPELVCSLCISQEHAQEQEIAEQLDVCRLSCPTQLSHERHCAFVEQ